ncbi:hypothetical protein C8R47DRAFT_1206235 [Mycena vitilis]|nr:hypothetical protein C8R47DRAFT_1214863 [Mycena vitilis]KAJ6514873.1 hypothetical protein C8R47DRAFT_1206235 [Mycena vitilis]
MSLPRLSRETKLALRISYNRARAWVQECKSERALQPPFDGPHWTQDAAVEASYTKTRAQNAFRHFVKVRFHKIHRARLRRYQRLKYLYELVHPPFATAEFPEHPSMELWRAPLDLQSSGWVNPAPPSIDPQFLREEDDEISPILTTCPLP